MNFQRAEAKIYESPRASKWSIFPLFSLCDFISLLMASISGVSPSIVFISVEILKEGVKSKIVKLFQNKFFLPFIGKKT